MTTPAREALLKISLKGAPLPVWRRVAVPPNISLDELHIVIQIVMGWENSHLYEFHCQERRFSNPDFDLDDARIGDATDTPLNELLKIKGDTIAYIYDFGDGWQHAVTLENMQACPSEELSPRLIDGERACPPEDSGGVGGYADFLEVLRDPQDPEHESMLNWRGPFDPEKFDQAAAERIMYFRYHA